MNIALKRMTLAVVSALTVGLSAGEALAANPQIFVLPTPTNNPNASFGVYLDALGVPREAILMDGIPIAFKYDDFWSYSGPILSSIQSVNPSLLPTATFGQYDFSTGTGVILVNLSSVAGGATNPFGLQDPVNLSGGGDTVQGWVCGWGGDPQYCRQYDPTSTTVDASKSYSNPASTEGTTSTVGEMLAAIQSIDPTYKIPVIYADYNQSGVGDSLFASAQIQIIDPNTNTVVKSWQLDAKQPANNVWDQAFPTYNFGEIEFTSAAQCAADGFWDPLTGKGCAGVTTSGLTYTGSHNKGSGHADFMVFAEDMNLTQFDPNFLFVATLNLGCNSEGLTSPVGYIPGATATTTQGCNTNGYEEFGLIGGIAPTQVGAPEPGSLALLGLGGLAAASFVRRRKSA
jgi:PEP-CTERM motif-containing protein